MPTSKEKPSGIRNKKMKKWLVFVVVAVACVLAVYTAFQLEPAAKKLKKNTTLPTKGMIVTVRSVNPGTYAAVITAFGEVVPHKQATIKTQVDGQVVFLSDQLETGNMVKKGELLARLEPSAFRMQVAEAENRLALAKINLLREEQEAKEARTNWQQSGLQGKPSSPLVLREPQLAAARSEVDAAGSTLEHAQIMLKNTAIRAPFDAMIIRRNINLGEILFTADEIATVFGVESAEISIHIDPANWSLLPEPAGDAQVSLFDTGQAASWQADVIRKSNHLNSKSRLRTLVLQVTQPLSRHPQLLPGTFVRAEITGRQVPDLLRIPESALTSQGLVWFVDSNNQLHKFAAEPLFFGKDVVFIPLPETIKKTSLLVAVSPNASFVSGLVIQPVTEKKRAQHDT